MNSPKIAVVIPNWNGKDMLMASIDSLLGQNTKTAIIVVDNGSSDGSQAAIKKDYPNVQLVELDKNYGFAGGVNAGIKAAQAAGAEMIALLNNDAIAEPDWLSNLVKTMGKNEKVGIVTSKILREDKKHLDSTGDFYSIWGLPFPRGRNQADKGQYDKETEVFGASGGASLYRTELFNDIGLFDEDFFAYFEDVDVSFRAQLAGWRVVYEPTARVYHRVNATSSKLGDFSRYHSAKNFMLLYAKNIPGKLYWKYLPLFTLQLFRWALSSLLRGKFLPFIKGIFAAVRLHRNTRVKRKEIQSARKSTVSYIDSVLYHGRPPKPPIFNED